MLLRIKDTMMRNYLIALFSILLLDSIGAFTTPSDLRSIRRLTHLNVAEDSNPLVEDIQTRFRIFQESNAAGSSFKQVLADVIAGEYNKQEIKAEVVAAINSAPCGKLQVSCNILLARGYMG